MDTYQGLSAGLTARLALEKNEFHFTHALGQNFILDDGLMERIVDEAGVAPGDRVLEIGAGAGVLTRHLIDRGASVTAVEVDASLRPVLGAVLGDMPVKLVFEDIMKADLHALMGDGPYDVVANLPYYMTADVILKLLTDPAAPRRVTVMVQREAADRMTASPGTKTWCALTATVSYFARAERLFEVPPECFTPPPHVTSLLLKLTRYEPDEMPCRAEDQAALLKLIGAAFAMRRKTLQNNLTAAYGVPRERATRWIEAAGLPAQIRGEALTVPQLCRLSDIISSDPR